jgi:hypothetical protein
MAKSHVSFASGSATLLIRCRDLALHSSQQHKNVHFCLHCSARFRTKRNLTTHLKVVHNDLEGILRYHHVFYRTF